MRQSLLARDIPTAHTPSGGWQDQMPPPVLAGCIEPIADGLPDFRGTWKAVHVTVDGVEVDDLRHVERIEQAGNRVVITARPIIHDMFADGTLENGVNDVSAIGFNPISVAATFEEGALVLRPNNAFIAVTRHLEGEELVWNLLPMKRVTRMRRIGGPNP
jgi:hypothetical protein